MKDRFMKILSICVLLLTSIFAQPTRPPGHIAFIAADHNVMRYTPQTETTLALTSDADAARHYQWPTWSNDGRLAYFCCDAALQRAPSVAVYVTAPDETEGKLIYEAADEAITYAAWSPADCGDDCRDLAVLLSQTGLPFKVELIRQRAEPTSTSSGTGAPFYFSWSPDGSRMMRHLNNRVIDVYDVGAARSETLADSPALFAAPQWSPVDNRWVYGVAGDVPSSTSLILVEEDGAETVLAADQSGFLSFNWSPDGRYVGYRAAVINGYSAVTIIDAQTGDTVGTSLDENVIAFFWAPDSQKLVYLIPGVSTGQRIGLAQPSRLELSWVLYEVASGTSTVLANFEPTAEMIYQILYFDQFAISHQVWSPDSTHLVYAATAPDDTPRITILDTTRLNPVPLPAAEGVFGVWSYR